MGVTLTDTPLGHTAIERDLGERGARTAAGRIEKTLAEFGNRAELSEDEKATGVIAAFVQADDCRVSIDTSEITP